MTTSVMNEKRVKGVTKSDSRLEYYVTATRHG